MVNVISTNNKTNNVRLPSSTVLTADHTGAQTTQQWSDSGMMCAGLGVTVIQSHDESNNGRGKNNVFVRRRKKTFISFISPDF